MQLALWDVDPDVVLAWTQAFGPYAGVAAGCGNILACGADALVSPANSQGFMDGGVDLVYRNFFGLGLQNTLLALLRERFDGALPVGQAVLLPTGHRRFARMVVAPTMDRPRGIAGTDNVYRATAAALRCALAADPPIHKLAMPGMGTGIGRVDPAESAAQMCRAFVEVLAPARLY
jgi:O-acetyl-ADP-ribose deacetylase (regulator of RNase III)